MRPVYVTIGVLLLVTVMLPNTVGRKKKLWVPPHLPLRLNLNRGRNGVKNGMMNTVVHYFFIVLGVSTNGQVI
jgi:hypothetical protein